MFDFANMGVTEIIGQIFGFVAMGVAIFSFQARRNKYIMLFQGVGAIFWVLHYFLIGSMAAAALNAIAMLRNFAYMLREKMSNNTFKLIPVITVVAFTLVTVFTWGDGGWLNLIPYIGSIAATMAFFMKNENVLRIFSLIVNITWLTYNIIVQSIPGALNEALAMISIIIALVRFRDMYKKTSNRPNVK